MARRHPKKFAKATKAVILDFDGPMFSAFTSINAGEAADQLRHFIGVQARDAEDLDLTANDDTLGVLRDVVSQSVELGWSAAHRLALIELESVVGASPSEGLEELLRQLSKDDVPVAVASNNSSAAIEWWSDRQGFQEFIAKVVGRRADGNLLKPDPFIVQAACLAVNVPPSEAVFARDSESDLEAAEVLGVPFVGYASSIEKAAMLYLARSDDVVTSLRNIGFGNH